MHTHVRHRPDELNYIITSFKLEAVLRYRRSSFFHEPLGPFAILHHHKFQAGSSAAVQKMVIFSRTFRSFCYTILAVIYSNAPPTLSRRSIKQNRDSREDIYVWIYNNKRANRSKLTIDIRGLGEIDEWQWYDVRQVPKVNLRNTFFPFIFRAMVIYNIYKVVCGTG
jgi:hypothetical protein